MEFLRECIYIGESKRFLKTRIQERQKIAILGEITKSRQRACQEDHKIKWNDSSIVSKEE